MLFVSDLQFSCKTSELPKRGIYNLNFEELKMNEDVKVNVNKRKLCSFIKVM